MNMTKQILNIRNKLQKFTKYLKIFHEKAELCIMYIIYKTTTGNDLVQLLREQFSTIENQGGLDPENSFLITSYQRYNNNNDLGRPRE